MPSYQVKAIRAGTTVECPACPGFYRIPEALIPAMLPVTLICPHCGNAWILKGSLPIIPKTAVAAKEYGKLLTQDTAKEQKAAQASLLKSGEQGYNMETYPYLTRVLQQRMGDTLKAIKDIRRAFANLGEQYIKDCGAELEAKHGLESFNPAEVEMFFRHPYCAMIYPCENDHHGNFARFVLAPKFYKMPYSYTVTPDAPELPCGSFQIGITNVYLGVTGGILPLTEKLFKWPTRLSIRAVDNKVVGVDLSWVWESIPGVIPDVDHTSTTPSLVISKPAETLPWLMQHGVNPYSHTNLFQDSYISERMLQESFDGGTEFHTVWAKFKTTGRIGIFSRNIITAREYGGRIMQAFRGGRIMVMDSMDQAAHWRAGMAPLEVRHNTEFGSSVIKLPQDLEEIPDSQLDLVDCVGVDVTYLNKEIISFISRLYGRRCCIVVVGDSPLFDFDQEDQVAPLVWGLLGTFYQVGVTAAPPKGVRYNVTTQFKEMLRLMMTNKRPPKRLDQP